MSNQHSTPPHGPIAAIDVGSNTIHLVVAIANGAVGDELSVLVDELEFVRLGAGVGETGRIAPERAERALATLKRLRQLADSAGTKTLLCAATEVLRQASNGPEFLSDVRATLGLEIPVITGNQEAALTFWGAISGRRLLETQPVAVADLGGGSMELVLGQGQQFTWRRSLPLGSGALHERFIRSDPPAPAEMERIRQEVSAFLGTLALPEQTRQAPLLIACGGTATTLFWLARHALGVPEKPTRLSRDEMARAIALLGRESAEEVARKYTIEEARARILGAGTAALAALMDYLATQTMEISQRGIREGMILAYARHGARWLEAAEQGA